MKSSKKLFILSTVIAGSLFATTAYSQVYVNAHIGFGLPVRRVYYTPPPPPPPVVYQEQYPTAPVCQDGSGYNQDGYGQGSTTVVYENEFPGYAYYNYPVWNGHYRDRYYYAHYRPYFEREHREYFRGSRFDHERFEHQRFEHEHFDHDRGGHGWEHRGDDHRRW